MGMNTIKEETTADDGNSSSVTAQDYIQGQMALEKEARELMPYDPNVCTYTSGALRQNVYACLTCLAKDKVKAGICYSCSIQCHSSHELVELFSKRDFTCDCGTTRMKDNGACKLRKKGNMGSSRRSSISSYSSQDHEKEPAEDVPSSSNRYNHNFEGIFCSCAKPYNPLQETGNMFQCHFGEACGEDWFHDECIMGFTPGFMGDRKKEVIKKNEQSVNMLDSLPEPGSEAADSEAPNDDEIDEDIEPIPGFPHLESFDCFICWKCVEKFKQAIDEIPEDAILPRMIHLSASSLAERNEKLGITDSGENTTKKRKLSLPFSIFLRYGFRDKLKRIIADGKPEHKNLVGLLKVFPFLYEDVPIYEPDEDSDLDDDHSSIYDLGSKILNQLPREKAIESVRAYNDIKSKLTDFLKPFADNGKIVTETEVRDFFRQVKEENNL